jgi:5-methylcytosine-specific restriction endonuclease McrA
VLARDFWTCQACGKPLHGRDATVDHRIARSKGGALFDAANLQAMCASCNGKKGAGDAMPMQGRGAGVPNLPKMP